MRALPFIALVGSLLALVLAVPGLARASDRSAGYRAEGSYVAVGRGGDGRGGSSVGEGAYAASGFDVRALGAGGHGGFLRVEHGTPGFFDFAGAPSDDVMALDMGYSFGGPLLGGWARGLLGFVELGLTGWQASADPALDRLLPTGPTRYGFGLAMGAAVEGAVAGFRVGVAVHRRDVPFFVAAATDYASSTTVQLRIVGAL